MFQRLLLTLYEQVIFLLFTVSCLFIFSLLCFLRFYRIHGIVFLYDCYSTVSILLSFSKYKMFLFLIHAFIVHPLILFDIYTPNSPSPCPPTSFLSYLPPSLSLSPSPFPPSPIPPPRILPHPLPSLFPHPELGLELGRF